MAYQPLGFAPQKPQSADDMPKLEVSTQTQTTTVNATGGNGSMASAGRETLNHSAAIVLASIGLVWLSWYSLK